MRPRHPVRRAALGAVLLLVATQVWRLRRAATMELDHAAYWRRRAHAPGPVRLVALGDSLAQGLGAIRPEHSWVGRLADHLEARTGRRVSVVNLGVCGATASDVLTTQLPELPGLISATAGRERVVVALAIGTNDAATHGDPERYRAALDAVCAALPEGALVADVPDLQREPIRSTGARLAAVAREVVATYPDLTPVALEAATRRIRIWEAGPDLAHPSGIGYRRYGRAFVAALERVDADDLPQARELR